jgi:hypothetical protein
MVNSWILVSILNGGDFCHTSYVSEFLYTSYPLLSSRLIAHFVHVLQKKCVAYSKIVVLHLAVTI